MDKSQSFQSKNKPIIFSAPFTKIQYGFFNQTNITPKVTNVKQLILTQSYSNYSLLKPCNMINNMSSMQILTKDQSRNSFDFKTNSLSTGLKSPRQFAFGRSMSKGDSSSRLKKKLSNAKAISNKMKFQPNQKHNNNNTKKQYTSMNKNTLHLFKKGIKQFLLSNEESEREMIDPHHLKIFPIFTPKRKLLNLIPKGYDFEAKTSAVEFFKNSFIPIDRAQKKKLNRFVNSLNQNNVIEYARDYSLIKQTKFSEQYQTKTHLVDMGKVIKPPLLSDFMDSSNKEFNEHLDRELIKKKKEIGEKNKRIFYEKFKTAIMKAALHFSKWGISIGDFYQKRYIEVPEFNEGDLYLTICAIKDHDIVRVMKMIVDNNFLLHDTDAFGQTLLHWVSKRNLFQIISYMIEKGARVTAVDIINRTPLHIAAQMDHFQSTIALLFGMANPFEKTNYELRPFNLAKNVSVQFILRRAEELYIQHKNKKRNYFRQTIRHSLKFIISVEMMLPFRVFSPFLLLENEY